MIVLIIVHTAAATKLLVIDAMRKRDDGVGIEAESEVRKQPRPCQIKSTQTDLTGISRHILHWMWDTREWTKWPSMRTPYTNPGIFGGLVWKNWVRISSIWSID